MSLNLLRRNMLHSHGPRKHSRPREGIVTSASRTPPPAVEFDSVSLAFDDRVVLRDFSFAVPVGSMKILFGASGAGKSTVLKLVLGLLRPDSGRILVDGVRIDTMGEDELMGVRANIGMLFQESALFDSLTAAENVGYRLTEELRLRPEDVQRRVTEVLGFVGLSEYADRVPPQLSGGQRRRVAIARAMATNAPLLLFDDPMSGLDPITSTTIDDQIVKLRDLQRVTSIVVTHQIRDAFYVATHKAVDVGGEIDIVPSSDVAGHRATFMMLKDGGIYFDGSAEELLGSRDPYLRRFLHMTRPPWSRSESVTARG